MNRINQKWYEGKTQDFELDYHYYTVDQTTVVIGPRHTTRGTDPDFFNSFDGFLVVTESYIEYPINKNVRWFPWKEITEKFADTTLFGSLKTLNHWINELKLKKIYIHCDGGTHRAPSVFGAFLYAYHKNQMKSICENVKYAKIDSYYKSKSDGLNNADPYSIFYSKVEEMPTLPYFINYIISNPDEDLEACIAYRKNLPYDLLNDVEKKEYIVKNKINHFYNTTKHFLKKIKKYNFENNDFSEFDVMDGDKSICIWICALPHESYHGLLAQSLISNDRIEIYAPRIVKEQYKLPIGYDKHYKLTKIKDHGYTVFIITKK